MHDRETAAARSSTAAGRRKQVHLTRNFALLSLVPMVLLALGLSVAIRHVVQARFLDSNGRTSELTVDAMASTLLAGADVNSGISQHQVTSIDDTISKFWKIEYGPNSPASVTAWSPNGQIFYSTDVATIGRHPSMPSVVSKALTGRVITLVLPTFPGQPSAHGPAVETAVPITVGGKIIGAVQSFASYKSLNNAISHGVAQIELILVISLAVLWAILFPIVVRASKRLRRQAKENERLAKSDALTGLANRSLLQERIAFALTDATRRSERVGLLLLDLDRFKDVNDSLGHAQGDRLLCAIGQRLRGALRDTDTLARLGGDEFAIVLPNVSDGASAAAVARRLEAALETPYAFDEITMTPQASIGVALFPDHAKSVDQLLSCADVAMYYAKAGHSSVALYGPQIDDDSAGRLGLVTDLRRAMHQDEITCHYQPMAHIGKGSVFAMEALARWRHPKRGILPPSEFLDAAEHSGLMPALTGRVLDLALGQCATWRELGLELSVSVNISARGLHDPTLLGLVDRELRASGVPPPSLELEITESALLEDPEQACAVLRSFHDLGVTVALDDFGTGYSSLAYLAKLEVDKIKIDASFVSKITSSEVDLTIVRAVVDLAQQLGVDVLAEGVEDAATYELLHRIGCTQVQGNLLSVPMQAEAVPKFMSRCSHATIGERVVL